MAYRLEPGESVPAGVRRVVRQQLRRALRELGNAEIDRHEAVHQARKRFKKIRGVLRLVRFEMPELFSHENAYYRDAAGRLSRVRDAEAMIETFDRLAARYPEEFDGGRFGGVRRALVERRAHIADREVELGGVVEEVIGQLREARRRVKSWPLEADDFSALAPALSRTYKRGRRAIEAAYKERTAEAFHEWRKRVKYHWYHARLLRNVWPPVMDGYRKALSRLSKLLGCEHDLSVFLDLLAGDEAALTADAAAIEELSELVGRRREELRALAEPAGRRVYAEKPAAFVGRIRTYWDAWRSEAEEHTA